MIRAVLSDVTDVSHLSLVAVAYPLDLLRAVVLNPVYLLCIILTQTLELLALVLLDVVQHLIDLLGSRCNPNASAA